MSGASWLQGAVGAAPGCDAAAVAWRHRGKVHLTVIAKATFSFVADGPMALAEPGRVAWIDELHGNGPMASVRLPSDVAPVVPGAQVLVAGHAYSAGRPTTSLLVRLGVFRGSHVVLHKELRVQDGAPFQKMPLLYERAFGGVGCDDNPLGQGADGEPATLNILHPADPGRAAGLGAVGPSWPRRRRRLGDTKRRALEGPIAEIPDAFDWAYFIAVPDDQRLDELRGDEWVVMDGLTPDAPRMRSCLPRARGEARLFGLAAHGVPDGHVLPLRADTLVLDTDARTASVVWRNHVELASEEALSRVVLTCGVETYDSPIFWPDPPARAAGSVPVGGPPPLTRDPEKTACLESEKTAAFVPGAPPLAAAEPTSTLAVSPSAIAEPLPFLDAMGPSPLSFSRGAPEPREEVGTGTLAADSAALPMSAPPFARPTPDRPSAPGAPSKPASLPTEPAPGWTAEAAPASADKPSPAAPGKPSPPESPVVPEPPSGSPAASSEPAPAAAASPEAAAPAPRRKPRPKPTPPARPRPPRPQIPGAPPSVKLGLYGGFGS